MPARFGGQTRTLWPSVAICGGRLFCFTCMPTYATLCPTCRTRGEITKPMQAEMPACSKCGATLRQVYTAPALVSIGGVSNLEKSIGPARFARFEARRDATLKRAAAGRLTNYERALETI